MSRIRAAAATAALGAFLLVGVGAATAHADNGAGSTDHSTGSVVSDAGSGNIIGDVHGNVVNTQQTATGSGAGNQNNNLAVTGNGGSVSGTQNNSGNTGAPQGNGGDRGEHRGQRLAVGGVAGRDGRLGAQFPQF
ncbi:hypothetical protein ACIQOV_23240, partial [Kitasatospora sp. NPDC091257]|uniref:hypothetical protein n=1 Tax=Kitasatospora sp. NPDC091257 TaxID=3364084 RepID=UPI00382D2F80